MADPVRDFLADSNGDLAVVNGDFATVAGEAAVEQGIGIRLSMFKGESFLDEDVGLPWLQDILIKNADPAAVRALLNAEIASVPDVTSVLGTELVDEGNRESSVAYQVTTVYSENPLSGKTDTI
jgi:hypothetical protein